MCSQEISTVVVSRQVYRHRLSGLRNYQSEILLYGCLITIIRPSCVFSRGAAD